VEADHWWHEAMRAASATLLAAELGRGGLALLDAGCGTGGFLRWAATTGAFDRRVGCDLSRMAVDLAAARTPGAEFHVAPLDELPLADGTFDLVSVNDVLQHVPEDRVVAALEECGRVLRPGGALLLRVGGARTARRERADWRLYDRPSLHRQLTLAGLHPRRITYVSLVPSLWAAARGAGPTAPAAGAHARDGVPDPASPLRDRLGRLALGVERHWLAAGRDVRFGHTILAVATA
jgi:SAM-dependent methyltransferase